MRIDKLSLLNFRCFRQLDITFDEHITILVAPNGAGKTTVLDAVRLALFPFIRGFDAGLYVKDKSLAIRIEDVRLVFRPEALNMEMSSPAMITATGEWENGKTATWMLDKRENSRRMKIRRRRSLPVGVKSFRNWFEMRSINSQLIFRSCFILARQDYGIRSATNHRWQNNARITAHFHACPVTMIAFLLHRIISSLSSGIAGCGAVTLSFNTN